MNRIFLIAFVFLYCYFVCCYGQERKIEGVVYIAPTEFAEMAQVILHADSVTVHPEVVTYTDKRGYYSIDLNTPAKLFIVEVRYWGYHATSKTFESDSIKIVERCDFNLEPAEEATQLSDVVVTAKRKVSVGRKSYRFSRKQIHDAKSSLDLALTLPLVKADARTGIISSAVGDVAPTILINGYYGTNEELRSIPPSKIIRIDYYDIAPERYNTTGSVIDVITKPLDDGHHAGVEASVTPIATDAVARLYYNFNSGSHQFKFFTNHFIRYSHFGKKEEQTSEYTTDEFHKYQSEGTTHTRLNTHSFRASYSFSQPSKQFFELSVSSSFEKNSNPQLYDAFVQMGNTSQNRLGKVKNEGIVFTPVVDIYYDRTVSDVGSRLFANLVYTHNQARTKYNLSECDATTQHVYLDEYLEGKTSKNSFIAQVEYVHPLKNGWFYAGSRAMYSQAQFDIRGISVGSSADNQKQWRSRSYVSWEGNVGKFLFRFTPSINLHYTSAHKGLNQAQTHWTFNPRLLIGYQFHNNQRLRWEVETANLIPELGETTEAIRQIREALYVRNNPKLKNSYLTTTRLYHSWGNAYMELINTLIYNYTNKDWVLGFEKGEVQGKKVIIQQRLNALYSQYFILKNSLAIKPLGDESLVIRLYAQPRYQHYKLSKEQQVALFSIPSGGSLTYKHNNWGLQGDIDLPYRRLQSYFTNSSGWRSALSGFWNKGSWNVRFAIESLFVPESSQTINHDFIELKDNTNVIYCDNFWKASLSFTYYFSVGKGYKGERFLENEDNDRGAI